MTSEPHASKGPAPTAQSQSDGDVHSASGTSDPGVRTAMIAGWFGIAGTVLTALITWGLNRMSPSSQPHIPVSIAANAPQDSPPVSPSPAAKVSAVTVDVKKEAAAKSESHQDRLRRSPISFADWQAMVRDRFSVEQRQAVFGADLGKRVTWEGVFDQYNLITQATVTRDDAYILVLFETEADRRATPLRPAPALCHFPAQAKRQLSELRPGQRVVISGTLSNPNLTGQLLGTELQACELVAVLDER